MPTLSRSVVAAGLTAAATFGSMAVASAAPSSEPTQIAPLGSVELPNDVNAQYINGEKTSVDEYPFVIAGLRSQGPRPEGQSCTGSVVAPRKIVTAAHCKDASGTKTYLYGLDDLTDGGGFRTEVVSYKQHPQYVNFDQGYDVAVVTTAKDIPVPDGQFAEVATSEDTALNNPGKTGTGLGYGKKSHDDDPPDVSLEKADLPIREPDKCSGVGAGLDPATMICTGYGDGSTTILPGDSGGPLLVDGKIAGVASWSRSDFRWYSVFSRLNNEMGDWVAEQIGTDPGDPPDDPGDPGDPPDEPGDLDVSLSPSSGSVQSGQFAFSTVTVGGADAATQLSASGAPAGARVQFSPSSVAAGGSSQVFISTSFNTPAGSYEITISGNDGDETGQATYTLNVRNPFGGF